MIILHIIPSTSIGGVPTVLVNYLSEMPGMHYVVGKRDDDYNFKKLCNLSEGVFDIDIRKISLLTVFKLIYVIKKVNPHIIHSHGKGAGLYARILFLILRVPVVHTFHGYHNKYAFFFKYLYLSLEKILLKCSYAAIALSSSEKNLISGELKVDVNSIHVIPNFICLNRGFNSLPCACSDNRFKFITIARICYQKNFEQLFELANYLSDKQIVFYVIGSPSQKDMSYFNDTLGMFKNPAPKNLIFLGEVSHASSYLENFDAYISTSRWEGLPTSVLEAFSVGLPVIASDCVGNSDVVSPSRGYLVKQGDTKMYIESILDLVNNYETRVHQFKKNQDVYLNTEFNPEVIKGKLVSLYNKCLGKSDVL